MKRYARELAEWVEAVYGVRPRLLQHGRRHPIIEVNYRGLLHRFTISATPSDHRAPRKARALIRRRLRNAKPNITSTAARKTL
jgi:hypothetical protein